MIDYALRRRFSFFEMEPAFTSEGFQKYQAALNNETFNALVEQIKALNPGNYRRYLPRFRLPYRSQLLLSG